jgi:peptidoglycan/LPS O-acetylase OafA/YrhL
MNRGEIPALTGLRGVAAMCVVLGHYAGWLIVVPRAEMPAWYWAWSGALPGIGMSIFFTLSGFVIALSYSGWIGEAAQASTLPVFSFIASRACTPPLPCSPC